MEETIAEPSESPTAAADAPAALLASGDGRRYWRSLDELAQTDQFLDALHREFPAGASEWLDAVDRDNGTDQSDGLSRRNFLSLMGASIALAGVNIGCKSRDPDETIVPYVNQPEEIVPGAPLFFATSIPLNGFAHGALVESHEGRPTKIEGNPDHPATLGAASAQMHATILSMYDPDRSQVVVNAGADSTWGRFLESVQPVLEAKRKTGGRGMRVLSEPVLSPTLAAQAAALKKMFPEVRWHQWSALDRNNARTGATMAFGRPLNVVYQFDRADVVLALDSDFLSDEPGSLRYARQFMDRRRVRTGRTSMNRLYVIESTVSITGATADHRLAVTPDQVELAAESLAASLGGRVEDQSHGREPVDRSASVDGGASNDRSASVPELAFGAWLEAVLADLRSAGEAALVIAGPYASARTHALCHSINAALSSLGKTVVLTDPVEAGPIDTAQSLAELVADMNAGEVDALFILGGNPVYAAPSDLNFPAALEKVALRARLAEYEDETSFLCHWHIPQTHTLEQWSDTRAFDGTASVVQPLIAPLYSGKSVHEFVAALMGETSRSSYELVRETWQARFGGDNFETFWKQWLHDGVIAGTAATVREAKPRAVAGNAALPTSPSTNASNRGLHLVFRPDPCVGDGSYANSGWLQELPKPITKLTWENAALLSPATASRLGIEDSTCVTIDGTKVPAIIVPGHPDDCITMHLGYGRTPPRGIGAKLGFNVNVLRSSASPWTRTGARVLTTNESCTLARTQAHQLMHGRDLVRVRDIAKFTPGAKTHAGDAYEAGDDIGHKKISLDLYAPWDYSKGNQWGMVIDINACIGCNACVTACQSENNIPVVGKDQVSRGREMHWLRIDTYFSADPATEHQHEPSPATNPQTYFQPVPCMHCEQAPCEVVCPVGATAHDVEGVNNMVYNRCIGTRYCSNNCPYKVRRFNWLSYTNDISPSEQLMQNPNVSVRSRGVMEKCTYCIQRIDRARIAAKREDRPFGFVHEGGVQTACQQSCPTRAISFGNMNDKNAEVTNLKKEPTNYGLLEELNTKPRTTYLERFRNPNAAMSRIGAADERR